MKVLVTAVLMLLTPVGAHESPMRHDHPHDGRFHHHHHHHHAGHGPLTKKANEVIEGVEQQCTRDVMSLCDARAPPPMASLFPHPLLRMAPRDPVMEMMVNPMAPPRPMLHDIGSFVDRMMDTALAATNDSPEGFHVVRIFHIQDPPTQEEIEKKNPEDVLDTIMSTLMNRVSNPPMEEEKPTDNIDPITLSNKIKEHAQQLLTSQLDEGRVRMARRLTEVRPETYLKRYNFPLPYGPMRNRCLMNAIEQGTASDGCVQAIHAAEKTFEAINRNEEVFFGFTMLYIVLVFCTFVVCYRHMRKIYNPIVAKMVLKRKIVQTVYSNPAIKEQVEKQMGMSLGATPPFGPHSFAMKRNKMPRKFFMFRAARLFILIALLAMFFSHPMIILPILCALMCARCLQFSFCPPKIPKDGCSCCCCSATTEDVQNGTLTKEQECCTCCRGTGVCPVTCADCCGTDPDSPCTCCEDGCDCCDPGSSPGSEVRKVDGKEYTPIQVV